MRRKRSVADIIKDNASSSKSSLPFTKDVKIITRAPRSKVQCFCGKCKGKLIDPRTKNVHDQKGLRTSLELRQLVSLPINISLIETPISQLLSEPVDEEYLV